MVSRAGDEVTVQGKTGGVSESLGRVVELVMESVSGGPSRWHNHGHATGGTESRYGMTTGDYGGGVFDRKSNLIWVIFQAKKQS